MPRKKVLTGADLILQERKKQIKNKLDVEHDLKRNGRGQLELAAVRLLDTKKIGRRNPPYQWDTKVWAKMLKKQLKERLIVAGALIAARIDMILAEEKAAEEAAKKK